MEPKTALEALISKLQKGSADYSNVQEVLPAYADDEAGKRHLFNPDTWTIARAKDISNFEENPSTKARTISLLPENPVENYQATPPEELDRLYKFLALQDIIKGRVK